ncbi:hypothetical protein FB451DRAFT_1467123 [Mycena latifolia]|nr:hypothetical protein FB451DRAFT_1467123 [Mycena latifolia]
MSGYSSAISKAEVERLIKATQANILRLTSQIHDFESKREEERRTLARLWIMITLMGRIPVELLVEIFEQAVETATRDSQSSIAQSPAPPAFAISQVCSHWRQITLHTPKLWAAGTLDVRLDGKRGPNAMERYLDGLQTLLDRSAPLPVSLCLNYDRHSGDAADTASAEAIFRGMAPTAARWKDLKFDLYSVKVLTGLPPGSLSTLESLHVTFGFYFEADEVLARFFPACPRPRRPSVIESGPPSWVQMPWSQLAHLDLEESSLAVCRAILLQCTNLVEAKLIASEWDFSDAVDSPVIVLPFLCELDVQFNEGDEETGEVGPFGTEMTTAWPAQEFTALQMGSPHITQMFLTFCSINSGELLALLRLSPAITNLFIIACPSCIDNNFLQPFSYNVTNIEPLAPQLRTLYWRIVAGQFEDDVFEAAIRSRWWKEEGMRQSHVARLQSVSLTYSLGEARSKALMDKMRDVVEEGLVLKLS